MTGVIYIHSVESYWNSIERKPEMKYKFSIRYDEGLLIESSLNISTGSGNIEDFLVVVRKHFKGDLRVGSMDFILS